jgi:hypothetical protein
MSVIALSGSSRLGFALCGGLCLVVLVGLLAGCGGSQKSDPFALSVGKVAVDGWEHCSLVGDCTTGDSVSAAQATADEIVGEAKLSTSDKKKFLNQMLDWAEANEPDAVDSIRRRLDSLG